MVELLVQFARLVGHRMEDYLVEAESLVVGERVDDF
jgi:hypothetical protein